VRVLVVNCDRHDQRNIPCPANSSSSAMARASGISRISSPAGPRQQPARTREDARRDVGSGDRRVQHSDWSPLLYDLNDKLRKVSSRYLGDADAIKKAADEVKPQTEAKR
jgi:hypothetical protein